MADKPVHSIDVRSLAELLFREGSLGLPLPFGASALSGMKAHRKLQDRGIPGYRAELPLSRVFPGQRIDLALSGRADGAYRAEGVDRIEEIKSTVRDLDSLSADPAHEAQLGIYGWLFCLERGVDRVGLDLVYVHRASGRARVFPSLRGSSELDERYGSRVREFLGWLDMIQAYREELRAELADFAFPFAGFRPGQRTAAEAVFRAIRDERALFLQAPTGIGKTMAVLYPGLKALGSGHASKLFFLTAKDSGKAAAEKALSSASAALPHLRWISVTAKARICFMLPEDREGPGGAAARPPCDPADCPYARDYFAKSRKALFEALSGPRAGAGGFTRDRIERLALEGGICPFELSLDLSLYCDVVVADFNYAFDDGAKLKRYFAGGRTDFVFLVDEAHNLVERARSMFSGRISKRSVLEARRSGGAPEKKILSRLNAYLLSVKKGMEDEGLPWRKRFPAGMELEVGAAVDAFEALLESGASPAPAALGLYWELKRLARVLERYDESFRTVVCADGGDFALDFLCVDPSAGLEATLGLQRASVFFSGTLCPPEYFVSLIAPNLESDFLDLPSPFPPENCAYLTGLGISTKWKDRERSVDAYARAVAGAFAAVAGNQIVFSPSFAFQAALLSRLTEGRPLPPGWVAQEPRMGPERRREFVEAFEGEGVRGFAVSGGSFSESVDLAGERLVGALVFGVGLPQVNAFNETIRDYFEAGRGNGYAWAYLYPGLSRVLQAAGRVIRSESDRGFVLLMDERYQSPEYRRLIPERWNLRRVDGLDEFIRALPPGLARPDRSPAVFSGPGPVRRS